MDVPRGYATAGEAVQVSIDIGKPDKKVQGARLELVYQNTYREEERDVSHDSDDIGDGRRTVTKRTDVVAAMIPLFEDGTVQAGRIDREIVVPHDAPGSAADTVEWKLRAVVDRKMGNDAEAEEPFTVLSNPDALRSWAESSMPPSERVRMMLDVPTRLVKPGDTINGTLRIAPVQPVEGRGVRVQLKRDRRDQDNKGEEDTPVTVQLTGEGAMPAGADETLPFTLQVPADAPPSFRAQYNEQHWFVEGVIDVARALDPVVRLEIVVTTG